MFFVRTNRNAVWPWSCQFWEVLVFLGIKFGRFFYWLFCYIAVPGVIRLLSTNIAVWVIP